MPLLPSFHPPTSLSGALPDHVNAVIGAMVVGAIWQGVALAAVLALCLRVVRRTTASLRFALWTAALLLICALPLVESTAVSKPHVPLLHVDPRWSLALAAVWLALSLVRAIDLLRHALRLRSLSHQAAPIAVNADMASLLRAHRNTLLCTSNELERPGVIGFFHPRILVPRWLFEQLSGPELEQIVLHELEHLRRGDDWLNLFQKLALVVFPLNPALSWVEGRLCLERELACDEGVVRRTRAPRFYATCLARLAEHGVDRRALSLALGFLERQSELARRVSGVLRRPETLSTRQSLAVTGTIAALLLGGSAELVRCPQLVAFAAAPRALATNAGAPRFAPETWDTSRGADFVYTDAAAPHLVHAAVTQAKKPLHHKARTRRPQPRGQQQRAAIEEIAPTMPLVAADLIEPNPVAATIAPTLVRYTLVRVDGGWLLLQL